MKKLLLLTPLFLFSSVTANAGPLDTSEVITTEVTTGSNLTKENYEKIRDLKSKMDDVDVTLSKFETCSDKNMVYLGRNVIGGDADDCIDIQNVDISTSSRKPVFSHFMTVPGVNGQLADTYSPGDTTKPWGRIRADYLCKTDVSNTRAMTYDDVKYIINQLPLANNKFEDGDSDNYSKIWVFDAENSFLKTDTLATRFASTLETNNCLGWRSNDSANSGVVLEIKTYTTNNYISYGTETCNNKALIACITN